MQSYDERCERPNFAPFKRPTRRRASPFLIANDKYSCQNLGSLSPNPYFCRISHNKRELFLARTQTVYSANLESTPHSTRSMRPSLAEIQKKRRQHLLAGFCSPFTDSFLSFEHEHCPTFPQSTALLRRWLPSNDLGQNPMDYHRREALRHVRRAAPFLLPTRAQRHPRSEARPRCHATFTTVNPNNQQL